MVRLVSYLIASMIATLVVGSLSEQRLVRYESRTAVFIFALILGVLNAYIKPVLVDPNAAAHLPHVWLVLLGAQHRSVCPRSVAHAAHGNHLLGAVFGSIIVSVASGIIFSVLDEK